VRRINLHTTLLAGTALVILGLGVLGYDAYSSLSQQINASRSVRHTLEVIVLAQKMDEQLVQMQTGIGSYLLFREPGALQSVDQAYDAFLASLSDLAGVVQDDREQAVRLQSLSAGIREWREGVAGEVAQAVNAGLQARALAAARESRNAIQELQAGIGRFIRTERGLLEQRTLAHQAAQRRTRFLLVAVGLLVLTGGVITLMHHLVDRRRGERAMRGSEERTRAILDSALDGIVTVDERGTVRSFNRAAEQIFGYPAGEVIGKNVAMLMPSPDREAHDAYMARYLATGENTVIGIGREVVGARRGGGTFPLDLAVSEVHLDGGRLFIGCMRDISARKAAERRQVAEHTVTRVLAESASLEKAFSWILFAVCESLGWEVGALWRVDREAAVLRCIQLWHTPSVEVVDFEAQSRRTSFPLGVGLPGRVWKNRESAWIPDVVEDPNFPRAPMARLAGLHGAFAFPIMLESEVLGVAEFFSREIRQPDPDLLRMFDIIGSQIGQFIERRRAEAALVETQGEFRALFEDAPVAYHEIDTAGIVRRINRAECALLGYEAEEVLGKPVWVFVAAEGREESREAVLRKLSGEQAMSSFQREYLRRDGTRITVEIHEKLIRDATGRVTGIRSALLDITERKAVERMKDEFVSVVSHELRTPLTSIRGSLGLLAGGALGALPEKGQRMLEIAVTNTDRLVRLINDILDIERIESGRVRMQKTICNAADLMSQATDLMRAMATKAGVDLVVNPVTARLRADPDRIIQTLTNLLGNAIKFSPPEGTIWMDAARREQQIVFQVKDQGRGIPADMLESIFERFQQVDASDAREKGGTGLGLAICKSIVQEHGGRIWVESAPGEGSAFFFSLEAEAAAEVPEARPSPPAAADRTPTVLVCDDDPAIREVVQVILERHGYRGVGAASGEEALAKAIAQPPAAILLDLIMPGMDGWVTLGAFKARPEIRDIPIILLSAVPPSTRRLRMSDAVVDWLSKPVDEVAILRALERALALPGRGPKVLIVEDDQDLVQVLVGMFQRRGLETLQAGTGQKAIEASRQWIPDLVVLDLGLPAGDGFSVVEELRKDDRLCKVPLVVYTARDLTEAERVRLQLGPTDILTKSRVPPEEFEQHVMALLDRILPGRALGSSGDGPAATATESG
jgi:PAS domain S-box-containing protein